MGVKRLKEEGISAVVGEAACDPELSTTHFMYVLMCADGTLYTGYTTDVQQRLQTHNVGKGAKYTRSRTPVELAVQVQFATKHEAMSAEYHFKRLSRKKKETVIAGIHNAGPDAVEAHRRLLLL